MSALRSTVILSMYASWSAVKLCGGRGRVRARVSMSAAFNVFGVGGHGDTREGKAASSERKSTDTDLELAAMGLGRLVQARVELVLVSLQRPDHVLVLTLALFPHSLLRLHLGKLCLWYVA